MLNEVFNPKPRPTPGPKQGGQVVTNPRALAAIAIKNATANTAQLNPPNALAQALAAKKKKKGLFQ